VTGWVGPVAELGTPRRSRTSHGKRTEGKSPWTEEDLVAFAQAGGSPPSKVQAVGGAVAQDNLVGGGRRRSRPRGRAGARAGTSAKRFRGELERAELPGDRFAGLVGPRARGSGPWWAQFQPDLAVERARSPRDTPSASSPPTVPACRSATRTSDDGSGQSVVSPSREPVLPAHCRARVDSYGS